MAQQPDFLSLGTYLHNVAGIIQHRSFHRLLRKLKSRFDGENSSIAHEKLVASLLNRLQSAIPYEYETDLRRTRATQMTDSNWSLITDIIAGRIQNLADKLTDYQLTAKQAKFSVPRDSDFYTQALDVMQYKKQCSNIQSLTYLKSPDGWRFCTESVNYISDVLFEVRSFVVAMSVLERETDYSSFEAVLKWAFEQPESFWRQAYPYDLLVHDYDAIRRAENRHGYIRVCKTHLSTYFSEEPIDSRLWQLGDFIEFRV